VKKYKITPRIVLPDELPSLHGKRALVTGGSRGIGAATAALLAAAGCGVLTLARRSCGISIPCDIGVAWQVREAMQEVGAVDIVVNCAGYINPATVAKSTLRDWRRHLEVNLLGPFLICNEWLQHEPAGGTVVNVASSAAHQGKAGWGAYAASKAALVNFTESLAAEGVRAYCVSPGRTDTLMRNELFPDEDRDTLLSPDDVARLVAYLCCPTHDLAPGQTFRIVREG
jgi:NAD(P)-dependent dehydrogenase (short-subunit alcohol dehydrogenase family)